MHSVRINKLKNRMYIKVANLETGEATKATDAIISEAKKLRKGFTVINDVSEFVPLNDVDQKEITRAQKFLLDSGMSRLVRIVGDTAIGQMQMNRKARELGFSADRFNTLAEAEKALDE